MTTFEIPYTERVYGILKIVAKDKKDAIKKIKLGKYEQEEIDSEDFLVQYGDIEEVQE